MKKSHEFIVTLRQQSPFSDELAEREVMLATVHEWAERAQLDRWSAFMSPLSWTPRPRIHRDDFERLGELRVWLRERRCLSRSMRTGSALANFLAVLDDLVAWFDSTVRDSEHEILVAHLRYKDLDRWDPKMYERLLRGDRRAIAAIRNLAYELTRAANFVCDVARDELDPYFRAHGPAATLTYGPHDGLVVHTRRPEYRGDERTLTPYPGFDHFQKVGPRRDLWTKNFEI